MPSWNKLACLRYSDLSHTYSLIFEVNLAADFIAEVALSMISKRE
jgi:hypothetical protein